MRIVPVLMTVILHGISANAAGWRVQYDLPAPAVLFFRCAVQAADGGFYIAGHSSIKPAYSTEAALIKVDDRGNVQWAKSVGHPGLYDSFYRVIPMEDGGCIAAGYADVRPTLVPEKGWIVRFGPRGDLIWERVFANSSGNALLVIQWVSRVRDTLTVLMTQKDPADRGYAYISVGMDLNGRTVWQRKYALPMMLTPSIVDGEEELCADTGDGFLLLYNDVLCEGTGDVYSFDGGGEITSGWRYTMVGMDPNTTFSLDAIHTMPDGGFVVSGANTQYTGGVYRGYHAVRGDATGNPVYAIDVGMHYISNGRWLECLRPVNGPGNATYFPWATRYPNGSMKYELSSISEAGALLDTLVMDGAIRHLTTTANGQLMGYSTQFYGPRGVTGQSTLALYSPNLIMGSCAPIPETRQANTIDVQTSACGLPKRMPIELDKTLQRHTPHDLKVLVTRLCD